MLFFLIFGLIVVILLFGLIEEWLYYKINKKLFNYEPEWIKNKSLPWRKTKMNNQDNDNQ